MHPTDRMRRTVRPTRTAAIVVGIGIAVAGLSVASPYLALGAVGLASVAAVASMPLRPGRIQATVVLLLACLVSEMFLGDRNVGPFSPRVYLFVMLTVVMLARAAVGREELRLYRTERRILGLYLLFIGWTMLGRFIDGQGLSHIVSATLSTHGLAVLAFFLILTIPKERTEVEFLALWLAIATSVSSGVAVLQWLGVPGATSLANWLRPDGSAGTLPSSLAPAVVQAGGLSASAFTLSYFASALGPLWWARIVRARVGLLPIAGFVIIVAGVWVAQERSGLIALVVVVALGARALVATKATEASGRGTRSARAGRRLLAGVLVVAFAAVALQAVDALPVGNVQGSYGLGRFNTLTDPGRVDLAKRALVFSSHHPVFGGANAYAADSQTLNQIGTSYEGQLPHNLFLDALVLYGIPGLLLIVVLLAQLFFLCRVEWRSAIRRNDWLSIAILLGCVGYLVNALVHNASFVTGDSLPWWLIGLLFAARRTAPRSDEGAEHAPAVSATAT